MYRHLHSHVHSHVYLPTPGRFIGLVNVFGKHPYPLPEFKSRYIYLCTRPCACHAHVDTHGCLHVHRHAWTHVYAPPYSSVTPMTTKATPAPYLRARLLYFGPYTPYVWRYTCRCARPYASLFTWHSAGQQRRHRSLTEAPSPTNNSISYTIPKKLVSLWRHRHPPRRCAHRTMCTGTCVAYIVMPI